MPITTLLKMLGLTLPLVGLAYGVFGGDGRIELLLLALGAGIFYVAWSIEKKRAS
jgi:uncharacterized membrane protein YqaE (UPF0057 family)